MSDTVLAIIGTVVGIAATGVLIAVVVFAWKMMTARGSSHIDGLATAAASHGWQFDHASEPGKIWRRWSGTTDGIAWTAEHTAVRNKSADDSYRRHTFRWRAALASGPPSPLVLIHERSSLQGVNERVKELPGFIRGLASAAIDHVPSVFFGREAADVDLSSWTVVDGHAIAGMRVLAPVADPAALLMCTRLASAIARVPAAFDGPEVPAILIRHDALHLVSRADVSASDVERAVTLGVGIGKRLDALA